MTWREKPPNVSRAITITGSRTASSDPARGLTKLFVDYLRPFAEPEVEFFLGAAVGIDTAALRWLSEHTAAALTVVAPCTVADQPALAADSILRLQQSRRLSRVVELNATAPGTNAYLARNRWMVDRSDFVIGFPRGNDPSSGTHFTLDYAASQGKPRLIVPLPARS
jgi:predicted Rossmann fold nucleotide-binding protein DprA/Smf involved in DNA uptake